MKKNKKDNENRNPLEVVVTENGYRIGEVEMLRNHEGDSPKDPRSGINENLLKRNAQTLAQELITGDSDRRQAILDMLKQCYFHDKQSVIKYLEIESFVAVLRNGKPQQKLIVLEFLAMGLTSPKLHQAFIDAGGFFLLSSLLSESLSSSTTLLSSPFPFISRIFLNLTLYSREHNDALRSAGALELLVRCVSLRAQGCIEALYVIAKVSYETPACRSAVINAGAVRVIIEIISNPESGGDVDYGGMSLDFTLLRRHAIYALYNLVQDSGASVEVLATGIPIISKLLDNSDAETGMWARRILAYVSCLNHVTMNVAKVGKGIVACLNMPQVDECILAAVCALAWDNDDNRTTLGDLGAVEPLISILKRKEETEATTRALRFLIASHSENQARAASAGAIPVLLDQLRVGQEGSLQPQSISQSTGADDAHSESLSALCSLLGKPYNDEVFVIEGGIQLFTQLISPKHSQLEQEEALDGLHTLARRSEQHLRILAADVSVFLSMAVLIQRGTPRAKTTVKCLIILIASAALDIPASVAPSMIPAFVADVKDEKPLAQAVLVLVRLAEDNYKNCERIVAEGVIPYALRLPQSGSSQDQYVAAKLLLLLYKVPESHDEICGEAGARCVLGLLRFADTINTDTKTRVSQFIQDLAKRSLATRELVVREGAVKFLLAQLAPSVSLDEQTAALRALQYLTLLGAEDLRANKGEDLVNYVMRQYTTLKGEKTVLLPPKGGKQAKIEANVRRAVRALWIYAIPASNHVCINLDSRKELWEEICRMFSMTSSDISALFYLAGKLYLPLKHCTGCKCAESFASSNLAIPAIPDEPGVDKHLVLLSSMCNVVIGAVEQKWLEGISIGVFIVCKLAKSIPRQTFVEYEHLFGLRMVMLVLMHCSKSEIVVALKFLLYLILAGIRPSPDLRMLLSLLPAYEDHESPEVRTSVRACLKNSVKNFPDLDTVAHRMAKLQNEPSSNNKDDNGPRIATELLMKEQEKKFLAQVTIRDKKIAELQSGINSAKKDLHDKFGAFTVEIMGLQQKLEESTHATNEKQKQIDELKGEMENMMQNLHIIRSAFRPQNNEQRQQQQTILETQQQSESPIPHTPKKKKKKKNKNHQATPPPSTEIRPVSPSPSLETSTTTTTTTTTTASSSESSSSSLSSFSIPAPVFTPPDPNVLDLSKIESIVNLPEIEKLEEKLKEKMVLIKQRKIVIQKREYDKLKELLLCPICMENTKNTSLHPCGHLMCGNCAKTIMTCGTSRCPICRTDVQSSSQVYL